MGPILRHWLNNFTHSNKNAFQVNILYWHHLLNDKTVTQNFVLSQCLTATMTHHSSRWTGCILKFKQAIYDKLVQFKQCAESHVGSLHKDGKRKQKKCWGWGSKHMATVLIFSSFHQHARLKKKILLMNETLWSVRTAAAWTPHSLGSLCW